MLACVVISAFALRSVVDASSNSGVRQPSVLEQCQDEELYQEGENPGYALYEEHWDEMIVRASPGIPITEVSDMAGANCH
jgi:hypothetical protein